MSLLRVIALLVATILVGLEVAVLVILLSSLKPVALQAPARLMTRAAWSTTIPTTVLISGGMYFVLHMLLDVPIGGGMLLAY